MQRYPSTLDDSIKNPRLVNVLVLENYTSQHYHKQVEGMINNMDFQQMGDHSKKYMRIATELPTACITFGNNSRTLRIHEAASDLHKAERDALKMSKFLQHVEDLVLSKFIEIVTKIVLAASDNSIRDQHEDDHIASSKIVDNCDCSKLVTPKPAEAFHYPVSKSEPHDAPNSVVSHISESNPYAPHSDSRPTKPFNHDNNLICHHEDSMRIPTHCYAFSLDQSPIPEEIITIRHGLRKRSGNEDIFCKLVGCFSSNSNKFEPANRDVIPIGGSSHLHYQMAGSQGELLHHLRRSTKGNGKNLVRVVMSTRRLRDPDVVMKEGHFQKSNPKIITSEEHCFSNTLSSMRGPVGIIPKSMIIPSQKKGSLRDLSCKKDTVSSAKSKWLPKKHKAGDIRQEEIINRKAIIGISQSYPIERIATSKSVAISMCRKQTTFRYCGQEGNGTLVGPTLTTGDNGNLRPIKPGERIPVGQLNLFSNIHSCKMSRKVTNISKDDTTGSGVMIIRRTGKNRASIIENSKRAIQGKELTDVVIRGEGGVISKASQHGLDCDNRHAYREAPTHTVAVGQFANQFSNSMINGCCAGQVFNLYYAPGDIAIYLGLFWVKEVSWKALSKEQCSKEFEEMERLTREIHDLDSRLLESASLKEATKYEVCSMLSPSMHVTLEPLFPNLHDLEYDRPWQHIDVYPEDFCHPKIAVKKEEVPVKLGFGDKAIVGSVEDLLELSAETMEFLTREAKQRIFPGLTFKAVPGIAFVPGSEKTYPGMEDVFSAAVHSTGMTIAKTFEDDTVFWKEEDKCFVLNPPRKLLGSTNFYQTEKDELNLKPLFNRPLHPSHLSSEPAVVLAWESSKSCASKERQQNGPAYILHENTKDEAFDVIFKCIMCSIINPAALLQIFRDLDQWCVPAPSKIDGFVKAIKKFGWSRTSIVHKNFDTVFDSLEQLIGFIEWSSCKSCQIVFQTAARAKHRETSLSILLQELNQTDGTNCNGLSQFQVHVIMRTIENCIIYPFGKPESVPHGHGSTQAAKLLKVTLSGECEVDQQIIQSFNHRYRVAQETSLSDHLKKELLVLGLDRCTQKKCLVHNFGIRKPFDVLDAEHMLCMLYTMYQRTLPNRNEGLSSENDCPKCFPIYHQPSPAKDLDVMKSFKASYDKRINAYRELLLDESYEHRSLSDIFRIDVFESEYYVEE